MQKNPQILFVVAAVILVTGISLFPSLFNGFVDGWDDEIYVTQNDVIRELSLRNINRMFTSGFLGTYCPLVIMSYAVEYHFFELNPFIYHLTNYLLHLLITALVIYFIYLLSRDAGVAFIAGILFGVHPLHVESVAWITERKDLLCLVFYIPALIAYLKYLERKEIKYYFFCFLFTILALFSKPMAITIPVILILLDYFYGRRIDKSSILEKIPLFAACLIFGLATMFFQAQVKAIEMPPSLLAKTYFISKTIPFYLSKVFVPVNLSALYPYYFIRPEQLAEIKYYVVMLILLSIFVIFSGRYSKKIIFGSAFFIITLLPVIQIIPAGNAFAADRYMYLPSLGIFYMIAVLVMKVLRSKVAESRIIKAAIISFLVLLMLLLSILTWKRCAVWKDTGTLFTDIVNKSPYSRKSHHNLAVFYERKGDLDRARIHFEKALIIAPRGGEQEDLMRVYKKIKETRGRETRAGAEFFNKAGVEQGKKGQMDAAISLFNRAVELEPDYAESYNNLGYAYYRKGDHERAVEYFRKAIEIDPNHERARDNLGNIQRLSDNVSESGNKQ